MQNFVNVLPCVVFAETFAFIAQKVNWSTSLELHYGGVFAQ